VGTHEVLRYRLLETVPKQPNGPLLIVAPAGYGKSVLARQLGERVGDQTTVWVDCSDCGESTSSLKLALIRAADGAAKMSTERPILLPPSEEVDRDFELANRLAALCSGCCCVILDNLSLQDGLCAVDSVRDILTRASPKGYSLIVTSRVLPSQYLADVGSWAVVDAEDLRFSRSEIAQLMECDEELDAEHVERAHVLTLGQAALLSVVCRHEKTLDLDTAVAGQPLPLDMAGLLVSSAATQLSAKQIRILYACVLLRHGSLAELRSVVQDIRPRSLYAIARCIPLLRVSVENDVDIRFHAHDLAVVAFTDESFVGACVKDADGIFDSVLHVLDERFDHGRLLGLLIDQDDTERLASWLERSGRRLLETGDTRHLEGALSRIGRGALLKRPALLLLQAAMLRETSDYSESLRKAKVARDLAGYERSNGVHLDALMLVARLQIDLGLMHDATESLESILESGAETAADSIALAHAYLGACYACTGQLSHAREHSDRAAAMLGDRSVSPEVEGRVVTSTTAILGLLGGQWAEVLSLCVRLSDVKGISHSLRMQGSGNLGTVLVEMARLERAQAVLADTIAECERRGHRVLAYGYESSMACAQAGLGLWNQAETAMKKAIDGCEQASDNVGLAHSLVYHSVWRRASGDAQGALVQAEAALEMTTLVAYKWMQWLAVLEIAANLLALGDTGAAAGQAASIRSECAAADASYHVLRADMILAEVARRHGRIDEAVSRFMEHEDYIMSESSNWQIAMYVRAFPELLGLLASAIDPDRLPAHLLRMVLPHDARRILLAARSVMEPDAWHRLSARIVGDEETTELENESDEAPCRIKLFGGLEVRIGDHVVADRDWRKRKARLLFAMLVVKQGADVPRDIILEHLWPEMDETRARNNLYVVWSAMKSALMPDAEKSTQCPFMESVGGVCRAVSATMRSDVDEFEAANSKARVAVDEGRIEAAARSYERMAEIYRGPLLPGDLYEDWFDDARTHYRTEFGDAMLRAANLLTSIDEQPRAIHLLRRAIAQDPWREDLYQEALKRQIEVGQRGAAIETYISCKDRLAEDLGLDPSQATRQLYDCILAMEDGPATPLEVQD
jgi:DNA-binding SARP family transcriptional activator/ATP/maltotriose-dependent transcriptional regulator MalT